MTMKSKQGQLTLFIIVALIIIIVGTVSAVLWHNHIASKRVQAQELTQIKQEIDSYVYQAFTDSLIVVGLQGGYTYIPELSLKTNTSAVAYWYYEGKDTKPSIEMIEHEIEKYVNDNLQVYLSSIEKNSGINIGKLTTIVKIKTDKVTFHMDCIVSVTKNNHTTEFKNFDYSTPCKFLQLYKTASSIVTREMTDPNHISIDNTFNATILPYSSDVIIYMLTGSMLNGKPCNLLFANKFKH